MSDAARSFLANYFSSQPPTKLNPISSPLAAEGEYIYENGLPAENVFACKLCYGAHGEGHDDAPRLAGQHKGHLENEIMTSTLCWRENILMHPIALEKTADSIDEIAAYLAND